MPNVNANLRTSKERKNDLFFTRYDDIEAEVKHYRPYLKGKIIYCNTDEPGKSNFYHFFKNNFNELGLKKLICSHYSPITPPTLFEPNPISKPAFKSILTAKGERIERLKGDGDFRSTECTELLAESDIVITNPPFSLFREYVSQLIDNRKQYLIIGNLNAVTYNCFFPVVMKRLCWFGKTRPKTFIKPDGTTTHFNNIRWFTNVGEKPDYPPLPLTAIYDAQNYPFYDDYPAIEVNRLKLIPSDYKGVMGVPITLLEKWNPKQFEIIGKTSHRGKGEFDLCDSSIGGKSKYDRVLIKRIC
jgi:hypothetical protein